MFQDEREGTKVLKRPKSYRPILESVRSNDFINGAAHRSRTEFIRY